MWRQSAGSRITTCWNVRTPHPPTLTQKQTHLSGSTRYKAPDAYVQLCFLENGLLNIICMVCMFSNEMCIVLWCVELMVCTVYVTGKGG